MFGRAFLGWSLNLPLEQSKQLGTLWNSSFCKAASAAAAAVCHLVHEVTWQMWTEPPHSFGVPCTLVTHSKDEPSTGAVALGEAHRAEMGRF